VGLQEAAQRIAQLVQHQHHCSRSSASMARWHRCATKNHFQPEVIVGMAVAFRQRHAVLAVQRAHLERFLVEQEVLLTAIYRFPRRRRNRCGPTNRRALVALEGVDGGIVPGGAVRLEQGQSVAQRCTVPVQRPFVKTDGPG
jgi:uncharacterized membrane protein YgcG